MTPLIATDDTLAYFQTMQNSIFPMMICFVFACSNFRKINGLIRLGCCEQSVTEGIELFGCGAIYHEGHSLAPLAEIVVSDSMPYCIQLGVYCNEKVQKITQLSCVFNNNDTCPNRRCFCCMIGLLLLE